ncbi:two-component system, OmpR family, sensor histidine kinase BaeS [Halobacillus karajensis]|uniref:sensor histidine kinase n=1 Tax=Halobacillus karajensis TaxID=195088 RepID=UPI0008A72357|nr:ATP-binding protein [Halobacillus karajensis]SEH77469.1 two-component system, OmpR family, sensor histidine kinase BaeS [Halobacillus karajensis]
MFNKISWLPKRFLWRLTLLNIAVVSAFIVLSSWAIYNTACFLVDGMAFMNVDKQAQFNSTLFHYLWVFSLTAIVVGSMIHFYLTKKLIHPLRELIESTKSMKRGHYPAPIESNSKDETGELIGHFNGLVRQLQNNHQHRQKLVSDLSHEFRTPLSNLKGYLGALKNGVIEGDQHLYQSLYEESQRLTNMLEQLEQLKEWDYVSHQSFSAKEAVDMALLIDQSVEMFRWPLEKVGVSVDVQADHGKVNVYNEGIQQVISNLLDNAIRYYQGSGPIVIKGKLQESEYKVSVAGPGQPIPTEKQNKIFERFYRVDSSRNRETGGTGLGLAITKEIVEHHNGRVGVSSRGDHHTFWFILPLC